MDEPPAVQEFIAARQLDLLNRAIDTLRSCPDADLGAQAHRLAGTLGTYQLPAAQRAARALEDVAADPGSSPDLRAQALSTTLDELSSAAADIEAAPKKEASP